MTIELRNVSRWYGNVVTGIRLREVQPTDESLESVFAYLVAD